MKVYFWNTFEPAKRFFTYNILLVTLKIGYNIYAVIGKAAELVGFPHMIKLAGSSKFRHKVTGEYNVDYKQVLARLFLNRGNHSPA